LAIAKAPSSNDLQSTLARDWAFQVNTTPNEDTPTWVYVRGLSKFAPAITPGMQDDSDIDSEGYTSQIATTLTATFEGSGKRKGKNASAGFTQDPGQAFLRSVGQQMGFMNVVQARCWRTDGVDEGYDGAFSVEWTDEAGETMSSTASPSSCSPVASRSASSRSSRKTPRLSPWTPRETDTGGRWGNPRRTPGGQHP